ncbi:MAG: alpha/beta fold hydrolase [Bacillus sp. (in: firmicutes)]
MIIIDRGEAGNIPFLHIYKQSLKEQELPFVMFVHGFESSKDRNIQYAYLLAEKGIRVILPDALYHGERREKEQLTSHFWNIVIQMIHELQFLKDQFVENRLANPRKIAVGGTSMGAIVTLGAMAKYDWISAGISMMGSPSYAGFAQYQLELMQKAYGKLPLLPGQIEDQLRLLSDYEAVGRLETWRPVPLFFWHGKADQTVPYKWAYAFYEQLHPLYARLEMPLHFRLDEKAGHAVPNDAVHEVTDWLAEQLAD